MKASSERVLNNDGNFVPINQPREERKSDADERVIKLKAQLKKVSDELIRHKEGSYYNSLKESLNRVITENKALKERLAQDIGMEDLKNKAEAELAKLKAGYAEMIAELNQRIDQSEMISKLEASIARLEEERKPAKKKVVKKVVKKVTKKKCKK